jgi:hypothetical protein
VELQLTRLSSDQVPVFIHFPDFDKGYREIAKSTTKIAVGGTNFVPTKGSHSYSLTRDEPLVFFVIKPNSASFTPGAGATLAVEITATVAGSVFPLLQVSGPAPGVVADLNQGLDVVWNLPGGIINVFPGWTFSETVVVPSVAKGQPFKIGESYDVNLGSFTIDPAVGVPVPEPSAVLLLAAGLVAVARAKRRRRD